MKNFKGLVAGFGIVAFLWNSTPAVAGPLGGGGLGAIAKAAKLAADFSHKPGSHTTPVPDLLDPANATPAKKPRNSRSVAPIEKAAAAPEPQWQGNKLGDCANVFVQPSHEFPGQFKIYATSMPDADNNDFDFSFNGSAYYLRNPNVLESSDKLAKVALGLWHARVGDVVSIRKRTGNNIYCTMHFKVGGTEQVPQMSIAEAPTAETYRKAYGQFVQPPATQQVAASPAGNQTVAQQPTVQPQQQQQQQITLEPTIADFMNRLNAERTSRGLPPVSYDQNLTNWGYQNNLNYISRGYPHTVMGPARRQNWAGGNQDLVTAWMNSPGHRAALLDPTITYFGLAGTRGGPFGVSWTFNAY